MNAQIPLEILRRVRDGRHLGGGDLPFAGLQDEVDRLAALRLVEPDEARPYRLTTLCAMVLSAMAPRPFDRRPPGSAG